MLGVGRPLAWKYSLVELLAAYPVLIVGGFGAMVLLTAWAKNRDAEESMEQGTWSAGNAALAGW
jgi:ABC-type phosphate transport system permease subunit